MLQVLVVRTPWTIIKISSVLIAREHADPLGLSKVDPPTRNEYRVGKVKLNGSMLRHREYRCAMIVGPSRPRYLNPDQPRDSKPSRQERLAFLAWQQTLSDISSEVLDTGYEDNQAKRIVPSQ